MYDHIVAQLHGTVHQRRVQTQAAIGPHAAPAALRRRIAYAFHLQAHAPLPQAHAGRKHLGGAALSPVPQTDERIAAARHEQPSVKIHAQRQAGKRQAQFSAQPGQARAVPRHKRRGARRRFGPFAFNPRALLLDKRFDLSQGHMQRRMRNKRTPAFHCQRKGAPVGTNQPIRDLHASTLRGSVSHSSCRDNSRPCAQRWRRSWRPAGAAARCGGSRPPQRD